MNGKKYLLSPARQTLLSLLRAALHAQAVQTAPGFGGSQPEWEEVFGLAARQGVLAVAYDGVMTLPPERRPAQPLLLRWGVSVLGLEERYAAQVAALRALSELWGGAGVSPILLKGVTLARNYPVPDHRECGDIDVYTGPQYAQVNAMASDMGAAITQHVSKHFEFTFRGVMVENHRVILEQDELPANAAFNDYLLGVLDSGGVVTIDVDGVEVRTGDADFNAVFVLCHAMAHFQLDGIALRFFCDWGTFLAANGGRIDMGAFRRLMRSTRFERLADTFTFVCAEYLGFDFPRSMYPAADGRLAARIVADTFAYRTPLATYDGVPTMKRLSMQWRNLTRRFSMKWKFDAADGRDYYRRLAMLAARVGRLLSGR